MQNFPLQYFEWPLSISEHSFLRDHLTEVFAGAAPLGAFNFTQNNQKTPQTDAEGDFCLFH